MLGISMGAGNNFAYFVLAEQIKKPLRQAERHWGAGVVL
jgi:hypothetical protein